MLSLHAVLLAVQLPLLLLLHAPRPTDAGRAASGLTAEVYANSVMRGTPVCTRVVPNGWRVESAEALCPAWNGVFMPNQLSIRLTGTLTAEGASKWHRFTATVGPTALVRLWVDDLRLVDAWTPRHAEAASNGSVVVPRGYSFWDHANIARAHDDFSNGKIVGPESAEDCAARCDELKSDGCIGFVATPATGTISTCYLRKVLNATSGCAGEIATTSRPYSVYTRNSSCELPHGWTPPGVPAGGTHAPPPLPDSPTTPYLLPNVTLGSERPVFVRVDLRPADTTEPIMLSLNWTADPTPDAATPPIPSSALSPAVSDVQRQRCGETPLFCAIVTLKPIFLPRQARERNLGKALKRGGVFPQARAAGTRVYRLVRKTPFLSHFVLNTEHLRQAWDKQRKSSRKKEVFVAGTTGPAGLSSRRLRCRSMLGWSSASATPQVPSTPTPCRSLRRRR